MNRKISLFLLTSLLFSFVVNDGKTINLNKIAKTASSTADISSTLDKAVKDAVKTGTNEFNKNVKVIVDDVRKDVKEVVADVKKDVDAVVDDAKKEIKSVQGTIGEVKNTIYSVKASFDKIIILLKVLIAMVGVLSALLVLNFINKILKILKITKSIVNITKDKTK